MPGVVVVEDREVTAASQVERRDVVPTNRAAQVGDIPDSRVRGGFDCGAERPARVVAHDHLEVGEALPEHARQRLAEERAVAGGRASPRSRAGADRPPAPPDRGRRPCRRPGRGRRSPDGEPAGLVAVDEQSRLEPELLARLDVGVRHRDVVARERATACQSLAGQSELEAHVQVEWSLSWKKHADRPIWSSAASNSCSVPERRRCSCQRSRSSASISPPTSLRTSNECSVPSPPFFASARRKITLLQAVRGARLDDHRRLQGARERVEHEARLPRAVRQSGGIGSVRVAARSVSSRSIASYSPPLERVELVHGDRLQQRAERVARIGVERRAVADAGALAVSIERPATRRARRPTSARPTRSGARGPPGRRGAGCRGACGASYRGSARGPRSTGAGHRLTGDFWVTYGQRDGRVFKALADPTRRELLYELFRRDGQTLTRSSRTRRR